MGQHESAKCRRIRRDGWTPKRQLRFLDVLSRTRSVIKAAAAAGMSREGAYRLRSRPHAALFAALWDRALEPDTSGEGHNAPLTDGRLTRLLGNHFRRESNGSRIPHENRSVASKS